MLRCWGASRARWPRRPGALRNRHARSRRGDGRWIPERLLLEHNEPLHAFDGLRILRYREAVIGTEGRRAVASLVA